MRNLRKLGVSEFSTKNLLCEPAKKNRDDQLQAKEVNHHNFRLTHEIEKAHISAICGGGKPLPEYVRRFFELRFGHDFSQVRLHTHAKAVESARIIKALSYTIGHDVVFGEGQYAPWTSEGRRLLAHELTHVIQSDIRTGSTPLVSISVDALEQEADQVAAAFSEGRTIGPITGRAYGISEPLCQSRKGKDDDEEVLNPLTNWEPSKDSVLIIWTEADRKLYLIPGGNLAWIPNAETQKQFEGAIPHLSTDLGTLFEVPATGASGTRIFRAGTRNALLIDSGSDPNRRIPAAVYLGQFLAVMANLGLTKIQRMQPIHVHRDHIKEIPLVVAAFGVPAANVIIPKPFISANREIRQIVSALQTTTNPTLIARGFGAGWTPGTILRDRGGPGDIFRYSFKVGYLEVELVAPRSALKNIGQNPDFASYLTKVTRTPDQAKAIILGDFRGAHLASIRTLMEAQRAGSWNELFRGVETLIGFHHVGAITEADIMGFMDVLDSTLFKTGKLRVVGQTNPSVHSRARADTMELLSRLGVELAIAEIPTGGTPPSAAGASKNGVSSRGTEATTRPIIQSQLTDALSRIARLNAARKTVEIWRPYFEEVNPKAKEVIDNLLPQIEQSIGTLRQTSRPAALAALRVRTGGAVTSAGGRDYSTAGGTRGAEFVDANSKIPSATPAETAIGPEGFKNLEGYRIMNAKDIPLQVALNAAMTRGEFSEKAFRHMLSSLDPATRDSLLTGRRGGRTTNAKAFERVRAEFGFRQSVLGTGEFLQVPRTFSPTGRAATRGIGSLLALGEIWSAAGEPLVESYMVGKRLFRDKNLLPFVRRLLFWQQVGLSKQQDQVKYVQHVHPKLVGVDDGIISQTYEKDYVKVVKRLNDNDWDALYFEEPGLEDIDVFFFGYWLSYNVRNFDEFAELFIDSGQDAVTWETSKGNNGWDQAEWKVRVGRYETSGENHVEEYWNSHPKLTQLMRIYVRRIIRNTEELLAEHGKKKQLSAETEASIGRLNPKLMNSEPIGKARLKAGPPNLPGTQTPVLVMTEGVRQFQKDLKRNVDWWSPPEFWIYGNEGDYAVVGGADYNTYARLRTLETEFLMDNIGGRDGRRWISSKITGNKRAKVKIHFSRLVADPPFQIPNVSPESS